MTGIIKPVQNAATPGDHKKVAKCFEDVELQQKVYKKKELLQHYQDKSYLYGRRAQDLQAHTLLPNYEKVVKISMKEAATHRQMASNLESRRNGLAMPLPQRLSAIRKISQRRSRHNSCGLGLGFSPCTPVLANGRSPKPRHRKTQ